jgi:hypothetical protein
MLLAEFILIRRFGTKRLPIACEGTVNYVVILYTHVKLSRGDEIDLGTADAGRFGR